jgi:hypothetical protein
VLGSPSTWSSAVARSSEVVMVPHSLTHSLGFWIVASFFLSFTYSLTHALTHTLCDGIVLSVLCRMM